MLLNKLSIEVNSELNQYIFNDVVKFAASNQNGIIMLFYKDCMNQHFFSKGKKIYIHYMEDKKSQFKCIYVDNGYVSISGNFIQFNTLKASLDIMPYKVQAKLESELWRQFIERNNKLMVLETWIDSDQKKFSNS